MNVKLNLAAIATTVSSLAGAIGMILTIIFGPGSAVPGDVQAIVVAFGGLLASIAPITAGYVTMQNAKAKTAGVTAAAATRILAARTAPPVV